MKREIRWDEVRYQYRAYRYGLTTVAGLGAPVPNQRVVSRAEFLNRFLMLHPGYEPWRDELDKQFPELKAFSVREDKWLELVAKIPALGAKM